MTGKSNRGSGGEREDVTAFSLPPVAGICFFWFRPAITELGAVKVAAAAGGTDGAFDLSIFVYFFLFFLIYHALGISVWLAG